MKHVAGIDQDEEHLDAALWNVGALAELECRCIRGDLPMELLDLPIHQDEDYIAHLKASTP
jgi:hypothetical protein